MWIRSQDKYCLVDVIGVSIVDYEVYEDYYSKEVKYEIVGISVGGKQWSLGTYNTKEKAIEVLSEKMEGKLESFYVGMEIAI